jgi:CBS domain-containing protein
MPELTARDVMTTRIVSVAPDMSVKDAARLMVERGVGALPVVEGDELIGLVTEGDLIMKDVRVRFPTTIHLLDAFIFYPPSQERMETEIKKAVAATVREVMTTEPVTVDVSATVEDVATAMVDRDVSRVPVLDEGRLVGIVSKSDIVRSIAAQG